MSDNTVVMLTREGQRVNVPSAEVRSRYNSGQFGFPRDEPIAVYDQFVRRQRTVSPDEIGRVINDRVDVLPTLEAGAVRDNEAQSRAEAEQRRQVEQEYGDVGSMVGTAAENLVGGATFGLSHLATNALSNIPGLGALSQEDRMRRAQVNPATAVATDITGAIVPSVAAIIGSGGAATPAVGAGLAGAAARTGVRAAVGRAAGTAGRAVGRAAAQYTPAGAVTRGALAAGRGATSRVAGARAGAAAGLGLEGVIEGAAAGLGATIREAANNQGEVEATDLIMSAGENVAGGALFGGALGAAAGGVLSSPRVAEWLNDWSDASWLRSTGSPISAVRAESFDGQGAAAIGAMSRRHNLIETGAGADNSLEAIRNRAVTALDSAGQDIGSAMSSPALQRTSLTPESMADIDVLIRKIDEVATPETREIANRAIQALEGAAPPSVTTRNASGFRDQTPEELIASRQRYDRAAAREAAARPPAPTEAEALARVREQFERIRVPRPPVQDPTPGTPAAMFSRDRDIWNRRQQQAQNQWQKQESERLSRLRLAEESARESVRRGAPELAPFRPERVRNIVETSWREQAIPKLWGARRTIDGIINGAPDSPGLAQLTREGVMGAEPLRDVLRNARIFAARTIDDAIAEGPKIRAFDQAVPTAERATAQAGLQDALERYNTAAAVLGMTRGTDPTMFNTVWNVIPWGRLGGMGAVAREAGRSVGARTARATRTPGGKAATAVGAGIGALSGNAVLGGLLTGAIYPIMYRRGQLTGALLSEKVLQTIGLKRQAGVIQDRLRNKILGQKRTFTPKPRAVGAAMGKVSDQMRDYDNIAREVRQSAANPNPSIDRATQRVPRDLPVAAGAAAAMQAVHIDLAAKNLPRGVVVPSLISHQLNPDQLVSDQERSAFIRYVDGLRDPNSLTDAIMNGTVSYELVDAVREGHPVWYAVAKNAVLERLQDGENPLPYEERLALSSMFPEENIDPSVAPDMIRQFQEPFMARATGSVGGQMSGGGGSSPQPAPNIAQLEKTRVQQLMS